MPENILIGCPECNIIAYVDCSGIWSRIETGKVNTTISTLHALATALDVAPKKLLDFEI